jgi:hypothetical protein
MRYALLFVLVFNAPGLLEAKNPFDCNLSSGESRFIKEQSPFVRLKNSCLQVPPRKIIWACLSGSTIIGACFFSAQFPALVPCAAISAIVTTVGGHKFVHAAFGGALSALAGTAARGWVSSVVSQLNLESRLALKIRDAFEKEHNKFDALKDQVALISLMSRPENVKWPNGNVQKQVWYFQDGITKHSEDLYDEAFNGRLLSHFAYGLNGKALFEIHYNPDGSRHKYIAYSADGRVERIYKEGEIEKPIVDSSTKVLPQTK